MTQIMAINAMLCTMLYLSLLFAKIDNDSVLATLGSAADQVGEEARQTPFLWVLIPAHIERRR